MSSFADGRVSGLRSRHCHIRSDTARGTWSGTCAPATAQPGIEVKKKLKSTLKKKVDLGFALQEIISFPALYGIRSEVAGIAGIYLGILAK